MVNTLSGSVCAYRKETVKPRFIRIDEVMALLDVTQDEAMDIALAAGARYQLAKIILVHKERLMKFMKHSARVPSSNKIVEKKFVRIGEGSMTYSIGHELAAQGMHKNLSFFAFTATPKGKTLQLFGHKDAEGIYRPFHIYSMRQAIEEHFILDVLQNYMTYKMYYKIAKIIEDNPEFDTTAGSKAIINYETLHPHNISQKTAIMLEHFMNVTRHKIGGKAKAMVVTPCFCLLFLSGE